MLELDCPCIYGIFIEENKSVYIGSTVNFIKRVRNHSSKHRNNNHYNQSLQEIPFDKLSFKRIHNLCPILIKQNKTVMYGLEHYYYHYYKREGWNLISFEPNPKHPNPIISPEARLIATEKHKETCRIKRERRVLYSLVKKHTKSR